MTGALVLRPILDAAAPEDPAAPARRLRNTAVWMALSAWLVPPYAGLGTSTVAGRAWICGAFVAAAVVSHLARERPSFRRALAAAVVAAGAVVTWRSGGSWWGIAFVAFAALVFGLTAARRRWVRLSPARFDPEPARSTGLAKWLHLYAWIGLYVLILRHWAGQTMVVPTGSMQPTIAIGDYLLVDNFSYLFRDPRRWEIVVFEYPLYRPRYFVKRVLGLPGEKIEFRDGDLWVDGRIARKPRVVQETLWRELFPRAAAGSPPKSISDGFLQDIGTPGAWSMVSRTEARCAPAGDAPAVALFTGKASDGDVRLECTLAPSAGSTAFARVSSRERPVALEVSEKGGSFSFGADRIALDGVSAGPDGVRVEVCVADGEAWALVGGREVARGDLPEKRRGRTRIEIGARGGPASFRDARVSQDIVYDASGARAWDVPGDGFFFVGDNAAWSDDSRKWTVNLFHPTGGGPPLAAAESLIDESGKPARGNIVADSGRWKFLDVDGIPRDVAAADVRRERGVPYPFARRDHLVGKAILIFLPWTIREAGFRPRLIP